MQNRIQSISISTFIEPGVEPANGDAGEFSEARIAHTITIALASGAAPKLSVFEGLSDGRNDHISLSFPMPEHSLPLVRIHSSCLTGDIFGSLRCDCGPQLAEAMARCEQEGGVVLYLNQEGRGIGIAAKIAAYALQDTGLDTFAANRALGYVDDARDYRVAAQMLKALGIGRIRLLSNNPDKGTQLERWGISIAAIEATGVHLCAQNQAYLHAKQRHGHLLAIDAPASLMSSAS